MDTIKNAIFSECGKYRYLLTREWSITDRPSAMCIGLNPSNANAYKDDPTIRILVATLDHLGYGELKMCNLYALISSTPKTLFEVPDALGLNDQWLETTAHSVQEIIFCWGAFKNIEHRVKKVMQMFPSAKCFGMNDNRTPIHPMALMYGGIKLEDRKLFKYP